MRVLPAFALLAVAGIAHGASFDCALAKTEVERAICANEEVSNLDEYLGRYYAAARDAVKPAEKCLVTDQRAWIRNRRNVCKDADCLRKIYLERLAVLDPLQPGVTSIRGIELPKVKSLAWIVPPAADTVAAPPSQKPSPLVARGTLVNEVVDGDGFVVAKSDGSKVLFLPSMFIDDTDKLESLISTGGVYELRGIAEQGSDGMAHFAPGHCIFIYRVP